jgi:hypothetical protein
MPRGSLRKIVVVALGDSVGITISIAAVARSAELRRRRDAMSQPGRAAATDKTAPNDADGLVIGAFEDCPGVPRGLRHPQVRRVLPTRVLRQ